MKKLLFPTLALAAALGAVPVALAQNTLISGDLATGTNWDSGAPTTLLNEGIINSDNTAGNAGTLLTITGLFIQQTGGVVNPNGLTQTLNSTQYELIGGDFNANSLGLTTNSTLTISGGTADFGGIGNPRNLTITDTSVVAISGGIVNVSQDMTYSSTGTEAQKVYDLSGGSIIVTRDVASGFQADGTMNFSGDVDFSVGRNFGSTQAGLRPVNIGLGAGSIEVAGILDAHNMTINWTEGSLFSFSAATIRRNGVASTWESLYAAGNLLYGGSNADPFSTWFEVDVMTNTLTAIPEPSTWALLAAGMTALAALRRRRIA